LCREQGQQLSQLAASVGGGDDGQDDETRSNSSAALEGFGLFGIVKETGVDDVGLMEFQRDYFPFPLYKDEKLVFYNDFFGRRTLKLTTWNPIRLYRGYKKMSQRLKEKNLDGNLTGEGLVQGGIIVFGKDGKAKYAYEEETGSEIPIDDILASLNAVRADVKEGNE
jgi:hypothetical protein